MIKVFDTPETLSRAAADLFLDTAQEAVAARGRFSVALSGGHTPRRIYEILAGRPWRDQVPWPNTRVFWGDERCVADDDERSNARMARQALLDHVPLDPAKVHPIRCAEEPASGAARYDELLRRHLPEAPPVLDLVLLGVGQNGHTASLFPFSPVLEEEVRLAAAVYVAEQKMHRVTLTLPILNAARTVVFLAFGRDKAQILRTVLEGPPDPRRLPAQLIRPRSGRLLWMADRAAAALLSQDTLSEKK